MVESLVVVIETVNYGEASSSGKSRSLPDVFSDNRSLSALLHVCQTVAMEIDDQLGEDVRYLNSVWALV